MLRTRLSRALLATLAVATLASGGALVTSGVANASPRIDPGFGRGPPRIDPGFGNGPVRIDPGFGRGPSRVDPGFDKNSGPKYTVGKLNVSRLYTGCHWIDRPRNTRQPAHPGQHGNKVKVCY